MRKKLSEEDQELFEQTVAVFRALEINAIFNAYAIENVVFGDLKPGEKIPFEKFVEDLGLHTWQPYTVRDCIEGIAITHEETIADEEIVFFEKECFISRMNDVFVYAPQRMREDEDENGLPPFKKEGLGNYIMQLFPLFQAILATKVEHSFFESVPLFSDRAAVAAYYEKISKFLVAVFTRGLRQGRCVDRYLKDVPYLPYYVKRIVKLRKGHILLANSDTESLEFQLAVLSAMHFMSAEHTLLFERKAQKWAGDETNSRT